MFISALLLAVGYYMGVRAGLALTSQDVSAAALWPPSALLIAALLLAPIRAWPVLIAATLPAHVLGEMSVQAPLSLLLRGFFSDVTGALIGACFIRGYLQRAPQLQRLSDLMVFLLGAPLLAAFVSSSLDAGLAVAIGGGQGDYWTVWRTRLPSYVLASLLLAPLVVDLAQSGSRWLRPALRDIAEIVVLLFGLWGTCALVFLTTRPGPDALLYLCMPLLFLFWAAMRLSVGGVSLCMLSVAAFAISGLLRGRGPFSSGDPRFALMALQVFLIIVAVSLLLQSASLSELRHSRRIATRFGRRLQLALSAARMGTWNWLVGSQRLTWSNSADDLAGQELQPEMTMTRMLDRIHPDDRAKVSAAFAAVSNGADRLEVEFRWSSTAESDWAHAIGAVWRGDGARHVLGVHMNVSERKQLQSQLHQQCEQLVHLSRVAMLGELSGSLAHELSQPMTAILANAQAAHRSLQNGAGVEFREIIEDIVAENKRAAGVIRRLRALFSRGSSDAAPVDVNECVRDVLALIHSDLVARDVTMEVQLAGNLPRVWADCIQLQQVLLNLILNACDAMCDNGPGERYLRVSTQLTQEGEVGVDVYDRGSGIGNVERIFEPFFTTKQHGLGLGLAICHRIVSTHRGRLWATNNPQRGATMHIVLPVEAHRRSDEVAT